VGNLALGTLRAGTTILRCPPAREGVVSWNVTPPRGTVELRAHLADGSITRWLRYAEFGERNRSFAEHDGGVRIETDVLRSTVPFVAIETRIAEAEGLCYLATRAAAPRDSEQDAARVPSALDVPALSQYLPDCPDERGWCSPASLAMVLAFHRLIAQPADVHAVAREVYDETYRSTGNWVLNMAYAARRGARAFVAYMRDFRSASRLIDAGFPLVLSVAWQPAELPDAPLEASAGHLLVLRGFDKNGDALVNDPAQPAVSVTYRSAALERCWLRHGGVTYVIAPLAREREVYAAVSAVANVPIVPTGRPEGIQGSAGHRWELRAKC
jgi:hypothetical protein